ncbi:MAG: Na/Pi symporter, partial [Treponema sp.]|jgi:phosphate:Na+ symporter|nr:Na/Pi symporter [Treponema sp.]
VSAGLLTLQQSIGVIFGVNIGTTLTTQIIALFGFKLNLSNLALPAIGIGFILGRIKWKYKSIGDFIFGMGLLFLGLHLITDAMTDNRERFKALGNVLGALRERHILAVLIGWVTGIIMTVLINSSTATITIIMSMAYQGIIPFEMAAAMVIGSNIGTSFSAPLAALAGNTESKRTALSHVLFDVIGSMWVIPLLIPMLKLLDIFLPGNPWDTIPDNVSIPVHLAMLHTAYNIMNTALFLPFIKPYTNLLRFLIRDKKTEEKEDGRHYKFAYLSTVLADSPELNILRIEKEIRDMAGIVSSMYANFSTFLRDLHDIEDKETAAANLCKELKNNEEYVDEMRDALTNFLIKCTREQLTVKSERRVSNLLKAVGYLEEMSDDCYLLGNLVEKNIRKDRIIKKEGMEEMIPYIEQVGEFLNLLQEQLGQNQTLRSTIHAKKLEAGINKARKDLQKLSRKRIEAGKDVKTELFFIDMVRRIEKLGDYCYDISNTLFKTE